MCISNERGRGLKTTIQWSFPYSPILMCWSSRSFWFLFPSNERLFFASPSTLHHFSLLTYLSSWNIHLYHPSFHAFSLLFPNYLPPEQYVQPIHLSQHFCGDSLQIWNPSHVLSPKFLAAFWRAPPVPFLLPTQYICHISTQLGPPLDCSISARNVVIFPCTEIYNFAISSHSFIFLSSIILKFQLNSIHSTPTISF